MNVLHHTPVPVYDTVEIGAAEVYVAIAEAVFKQTGRHITELVSIRQNMLSQTADTAISLTYTLEPESE